MTLRDVAVLPPVYFVCTAPERLDKYTFLASKDKNVRTPRNPCAHLDRPAEVCAWLHANHFPSAFARRISAGNVCSAPLARIDRRDISCKARDRINQADRSAPSKDVVDGCRAMDRMAQGQVRVGSELVIVVGAHEVSGVPSQCMLLTVGSGWCTMTGAVQGMRLRSSWSFFCIALMGLLNMGLVQMERRASVYDGARHPRCRQRCHGTAQPVMGRPTDWKAEKRHLD